MVKLGAYGAGLTLVCIAGLMAVIGIHAIEIAGALCIERD